VFGPLGIGAIGGVGTTALHLIGGGAFAGPALGLMAGTYVGSKALVSLLSWRKGIDILLNSARKPNRPASAVLADISAAAQEAENDEQRNALALFVDSIGDVAAIAENQAEREQRKLRLVGE
jgi:hypothetical protein